MANMTFNQVGQKQMTPLVKMANGDFRTFNRDGQCYYSQMEHPTYLSTMFYNIPTNLGTF
jgi:hypothetical protein